ncbi:hypothetical protein JTE90_019310 [Oedothorax gibbosus]|uniref:DNA-directed DNA polymerase n=1 Tax=Oedothorax gibbosus TaxID=931172 RepID=A0AAV6TP88_9ARAC|nr:hypothetical protein JTE90_019310 [Oedothorax gibbosus]
MRVPYVIYADFECLTVPVYSCHPNTDKSYTEAYQKHDPISFCYYVVSATGFLKAPFCLSRSKRTTGVHGKNEDRS